MPMGIMVKGDSEIDDLYFLKNAIGQTRVLSVTLSPDWHYISDPVGIA
jgi:hypothetical protein